VLAVEELRIVKIVIRMLVALVVLSGTFAVTGCSTTRYREKADREVYEIIVNKAKAVPNMEEDFTIDGYGALPLLEGVPQNETVDETLGPGAEEELGAHVLSLEKALSLAVTNSRVYQNQKEALYLQALGLTLNRHEFDPIFSGGASGDYARSTVDIGQPTSFSTTVGGVSALFPQIVALTGTSRQLLDDYATVVNGVGDFTGFNDPVLEIANERSVAGGTNIGVSKLLRGGGLIALNLTSNFLRFLTGDSRVATESLLTGSFVQPLLRGAGSKVTLEQLTQAERDTLYSLRDFTNFRKDYIVDIVSSYYGVLQNRDGVRNLYRSYLDFQKSVEQARSEQEEGRKTLQELGRLEQEELSSRNRWISARQRYQAGLDQFKIELGLSTEANIILDETELDLLREEGLNHPTIEPEEAIDVALVARLDLYNSRDEVEDRERKVEVAENAFLPDLDLVLTGDVASDPTLEDRFQELDFRRARWSAGFDLDLPLDRKSERNAYRATLIDFERALREYDLAEDQIKLQVRNTWRNLVEQRENYEIALKSVELSQRRVEEQDLLAELGRATALEQVDARNALTEAQNSLTAALVGHAIERLSYWRDMGILYIKKDGRWEEVDEDYMG